MKENKKYLYQCCLLNNGKYEEDFMISLEAPGNVTALDEVDKYLQAYWGFIPMRHYGEAMKSDRYWVVTLKSLTIIK